MAIILAIPKNTIIKLVKVKVIDSLASMQYKKYQ
nr:MAG TPA: hypothetical protein [Bacteriophage sp.]